VRGKREWVRPVVGVVAAAQAAPRAAQPPGAPDQTPPQSSAALKGVECESVGFAESYCLDSASLPQPHDESTILWFHVLKKNKKEIGYQRPSGEHEQETPGPAKPTVFTFAD